MECRLRWRLCRPPPFPSLGILCSVQRQSSNPFPERRPSGKQWSTITDSPSTTDSSSLLVYRGEGEVLLSLLRQGFSSSPLFPPPSIINHSRSDRKSRDAPISSAPTLFSTGCFLPILALTISVSLVFPASGDLVNLEYETWKFLGTDWSLLEEKKRRLS